jgi:mannose-6-phosphate isomerase-like protein (cupin superfamily)
MRVGWNDAGDPQPAEAAVRGLVYRDLRPANKPVWSDLTSTGPWAIDPGGSCDRHYHDCDEYWLVARGEALVEVGGERAEIGPGDILCIERGQLHDIVALNSPLRAFWLEGPVEPGGRVGSLHRDEDDAAGHAVPLATARSGVASAPESLVAREITAASRPPWSDLAGAGSFSLRRGEGGPGRVEEGDEYWLVREGSALVEVDGERSEIGAGDVLCIEAGRSRRVVEAVEPLLAFWLRRGR